MQLLSGLFRVCGALGWRVGPPAAVHDPLLLHLAQQFSSQDLLLGNRRPFSKRSQAAISGWRPPEPFDGQCSCCRRAPVLTEAGGRCPAPSSTITSIVA